MRPSGCRRTPAAPVSPAPRSLRTSHSPRSSSSPSCRGSAESAAARAIVSIICRLFPAIDALIWLMPFCASGYQPDWHKAMRLLPAVAPCPDAESPRGSHWRRRTNGRPSRLSESRDRSAALRCSSPIVAKLIGRSVSTVRPWPCISTAITGRVFAGACTHLSISPIVVNLPGIRTSVSPWP